jgi:glyceraldehyde 3-phosphate dehydrogenase
MLARVAINGFGRIGRLGLRSIIKRHKKDLNVVAINDMADLQTNAHLFRYDSTYGVYPGKIEVGEGILKVDGWNITVLNQKDPSRLPWKALGVDIVIESTGVFTDAAQVRAHLEAGARKVIIRHRQKTRTSRWFWGSTILTTIPGNTTSSPTLLARPIALHL